MFTQELVLELYNKLSVLSKKDTSLPQADTVNWEDIFTIVQDGQNKKVNFRTFSESLVYQEAIASLVAQIEEKKQELAELMQHTEDILADISEATGVSQIFGESQSVGISLKTLTNAFSRIWNKLEDITGEPFMGITMTVNPDYFVSDGSVTVDITATSVDNVSKFDHIAFFVNGEKFYEAENEDVVVCSVDIDSTSVITCEATILGIPQTSSKTIYHYNEFWIGAGMTPEEVKIDANAKEFNNGSIAGNYDVVVGEDEHIILVLGAAAAEMFVRADMNGIEIPMTLSTIEDGAYVVFTSNDTFVAGTYNIDINS